VSSPQKKGHSFVVRGSPHCWSRRTLWTLRRSDDSCQHEGRVRGDAGHWENKKRRVTKSHSTAIELEDIWTRKGGTCQRLRLPGCRNCFVSNISHSLASHDDGSQCPAVSTHVGLESRSRKSRAYNTVNPGVPVVICEVYCHNFSTIKGISLDEREGTYIQMWYRRHSSRLDALQMDPYRGLINL